MKAQDRIELTKSGPRFYLGGIEVSEKEYRRVYPLPKQDDSAGESFVTFKPMASRGLAVQPKQVKEATEFAAKNGVPTEYLPDGRPMIVSSRHFRELAKLSGMRHHGY